MFPRYRIGIRKPLNDGTVRTVVAMAVVGQVCQRIAHVGKFGNPPVEIRDVFKRNPLNFSAGARAVAPKASSRRISSTRKPSRRACRIKRREWTSWGP